MLVSRLACMGIATSSVAVVGVFSCLMFVSLSTAVIAVLGCPECNIMFCWILGKVNFIYLW